NIGVGDARADHDPVSFLFNLPKFLDAGDIHEEIGLDQAHVKHRPQRLTAGYNLDGTSVLGEQRQRCLDIQRTRVSEIDWLHLSSSSNSTGAFLRLAAAIASSTRRGVIGEWRISAPRGIKASLMALPIAAGGAMAPPSPSPFTPNSVKGASVSMWCSRGVGI